MAQKMCGKGNMKVSIIITFYQNVNILSLCISSIIQTTADMCYEIVVVNDNPSTSLSFIIDKFCDYCDIKVITMETNSGYSAACNCGVKNAKYDYIVLMDCDIIPQTGWLNKLLSTYQRANNPGAVSSKILDARTNNLFGFGIGVHGVDFVLYKRDGADDSFTNRDREFYMVSSGCLLMRRDLYLQLGGQDETYYNADNDLDLTYRLHLLGKTNWISAESIVYHRGHVSGSIRTLPFRQDSKAWFFKKWGTQIHTNTISTLKNMYKSFPVDSIGNNVILVMFSNSLSRLDYVSAIADALNITYIQQYDFKNPSMETSIFINDFLPWDICRTNIPILYFSDSYLTLVNNHFWFCNRVCKDAIFDKYGNHILVDPSNY